MLDERTLHTIARRGVSEIIVEKEFTRLLKEGKPLRLKMGFDPSRPDIHLGHVVGLRKLRQLQELGHKVILIIGDWTAQIGDPTGQSATRPMLTHEEVVENAESYMRQFFKVVDRDRTDAVWQSEWFGKFNLADVIDLTRRFTVAQFLERDDFARRFQGHKPIAVTELLYPLLQAYDSVAVNSDVEFGGTDQMFNLLVGRDLQEKMGQAPQQCFLMPILVGTDGVQKMSKSFDNYIGVDENPHDMYGKVMSIQDELVMDYFEYLTDVPDAELGEMGLGLEERSVNPMELKKRLAREITGQFHGPEAGRSAEEHFERVVQRREVPQEEDQYVDIVVPSPAPATTAELVIKALRISRSEAKRLINQGAVETDGRKLRPDELIPPGLVLRVGKRYFIRTIAPDEGAVSKEET